MSMTTELAGGALRITGGAIARLEINAPERRNAISAAMWMALPEAAERLSDARVVVVAGVGEHFSAGADIGEFEEVYATSESVRSYNAAVRAGQQAVADMACPVIAAVDGVCVGGGCGLALHADLRVATDRARFAITPARLGLAYSFGDTRRLVETVGPAAAKDILFTGRLIGAEEALRIGMADRVVPPEDLAGAVAEIAEGIAANSAASHRVSKRMVAAALAGDCPDDLQAEFEGLFTGADFAEGRAAFLEKRRPRFG